VDIITAIERIGLEVRTILLEDVWLLGHLPEVQDHRDPFDRLLIAQAMTHGLTLITSDRRFSLYPRLPLIEY
jgi:PIN domain nuclease of toxin-antitoxin system